MIWPQRFTCLSISLWQKKGFLKIQSVVIWLGMQHVWIHTSCTLDSMSGTWCLSLLPTSLYQSVHSGNRFGVSSFLFGLLNSMMKWCSELAVGEAVAVSISGASASGWCAATARQQSRSVWMGYLSPGYDSAALINLINVRFDHSHQELLAIQIQKFQLYFPGYDTDFNLCCNLSIWKFSARAFQNDIISTFFLSLQFLSTGL